MLHCHFNGSLWKVIEPKSKSKSRRRSDSCLQQAKCHFKNIRSKCKTKNCFLLEKIRWQRKQKTICCTKKQRKHWYESITVKPGNGLRSPVDFFLLEISQFNKNWYEIPQKSSSNLSTICCNVEFQDLIQFPSGICVSCCLPSVAGWKPGVSTAIRDQINLCNREMSIEVLIKRHLVRHSH